MTDEQDGDFAVAAASGVLLAGTLTGPSEQVGEGPPIVLLHGLTATRRYVVMGSRLLERSGRRVIAYDARGHGRSTPAPHPDAYGYDLLATDLESVLDALGVERAVLAGASMGAQTALRFALDRPERVAALGLITPAFDPERVGGDGGGDSRGGDTGDGGDTGGGRHDSDPYAGWDRLARGLREGGVEGFVAAYNLDAVPTRWRETVATVLRQRLAAHEHPLAVADALEAVPRSRPFKAWADLQQIDAPTLVVGSRDEADPEHPLAVAERYAAAIPAARLVVEEPGSSPIAWQGGRLSKALLGLADS